LLFEPGERFAYSNLGYYVLAEIAETAARKPWPEVLTERIFVPLEMNATRTTSVIDVVPNRASGYVFRDDVLANARPLITLRASGALLSSVEDLVRWDEALTSQTLLPPRLQELMWKVTDLEDGPSSGYGFGWWIDDVRGHRRVRHGGTNPGYAAEYSRFVGDRLSVVVLTNGGCARPDSIAMDIADTFIPGLSSPRSTVELDAEVLAKYAGRYQFGPNDVATIKVDGNGLSVQNDTPAFSSQCKMLPESPTTFFIVRNESWVFTIEGDAVTQVTVRFGDQAFPATKIQ
jgi:CubicO group peptidase (beta-lactamase class C family)